MCQWHMCPIQAPRSKSFKFTLGTILVFPAHNHPPSIGHVYERSKIRYVTGGKRGVICPVNCPTNSICPVEYFRVQTVNRSISALLYDSYVSYQIYLRSSKNRYLSTEYASQAHILSASCHTCGGQGGVHTWWTTPEL